VNVEFENLPELQCCRVMWQFGTHFGCSGLRHFGGSENCARFELKFPGVINSQSDVVA
jgi:hypothetical protein